MINFSKFNGIVMPLDIPNVDTDAIIPKQFLQKITSSGFGKYLFFHWRFLDDAGKKINNNFILNNNKYSKASILLTRENFGCGSSREHALWALVDYGFRVILSSNFADIFYNNSINNQLLPITLPKFQIDKLFFLIKNNQITNLGIDLKSQKILVTKNIIYKFNINSFHRHCLLNNFDIIDSTLVYKSNISEYEKKQFTFLN